MNVNVIQSWTGAPSLGSSAENIEYQVIKNGDKYQQQLRNTSGEMLGTFDLPEGVRMDKQSYEVLLAFALSQVAA
ncbi:MAG: hypothetical protein AAF385_09525 [Pseudomonadota bacterium]